ncbi:MAG: TetR family transcriptional regulator [Pseudobutyrivibrio sp.]|nr:TetR family transcriptional regulator [Pseudobutyrivibrio sp.]
MVDKILEGALSLYRSKGLKFTMDELAIALKMSKKTIYKLYVDKQELVCAMVNYAFDNIKETEDSIYYDETLSTIEKLKGILTALPENYSGFNYDNVYMFKDKYPLAYRDLCVRLESDWDKTLELLQEAMDQGLVRQVDKDLFKFTYEAAVEHLLTSNYLSRKNIDYPTAFRQVVDIIVEGIIVKEK